MSADLQKNGRGIYQSYNFSHYSLFQEKQLPGINNDNLQRDYH
jgi:hypothetical protein